MECCEKCASLQNKNLSIALSTFIVKWVKVMLLFYFDLFLIPDLERALSFSAVCVYTYTCI